MFNLFKQAKGDVSLRNAQGSFSKNVKRPISEIDLDETSSQSSKRVADSFIQSNNTLSRVNSLPNLNYTQKVVPKLPIGEAINRIQLTHMAAKQLNKQSTM